MRLSTLTTTFFTISIIPYAFLFAKEGQCNAYKSEEKRPVCEQEYLMAGYNGSSRIDVCGCWDLYTTGSFIYWQPIQENMELGILSDITDSLDLVNGDVINLDFDYKPGFKVGLGMNFNYDNWDTYLQYTWLRGTNHIHKNLHSDNANLAILPAWQIPDFLNPHYSEGSEKWHLGLDIIDWDLARSYFVGTKLCFRPFLGARAAWIRQHVQVDYLIQNPNFLLLWPNTHITQSSNSWAVGPRAGLNSNWMIYENLRMYGNGEIDVLYTQYTHLKTHQESESAFPTRYTINQKNVGHLRTHLDLTLGFGWGTYFSNNHWHMDLSADYGFQVFFDQNMFRNFVLSQATGKGISPNGNLYIHGLTTSLRFDF